MAVLAFLVAIFSSVIGSVVLSTHYKTTISALTVLWSCRTCDGDLSRRENRFSKNFSRRVSEAVTHLSTTNSCQVRKVDVDYTLDRIDEAVPIRQPYEHVVIRNIFPPGLYACVQHYIPLPKTRFDRTGRIPLFYSGSAVPDLFNDQPEYYSAKQYSAFWKGFATAYGSPRVTRRLMRLFSATLKLRGFSTRKLMMGEQMLSLSRSINVTSLIHTDHRSKVVSLIYYLAPDETHPLEGTILYRSRRRRQDDGTQGAFGASSDFIIAKRIPFNPNTLFAFAPCTSSWHSVTGDGKEPFMRDSIQGEIGTADMKRGVRKKKGRLYPLFKGALKGKCTG